MAYESSASAPQNQIRFVGADRSGKTKAMLPRIGKIEAQFADFIQHYLRTRSHRTGLLSEIKSHVIHEGRGTAMRRSATELELTDMKAASAETEMRNDEIERIDLDYVFRKLNEMSQEFARQMSAHMFEVLDQTTEKTGQRKDARGAPLTNEIIIDLFNSMHIDFERSETGDVTIVTGTGMASVFERLEREMRESPVLRKKWADMLEKKRDEYRAREANRNLAG